VRVAVPSLTWLDAIEGCAPSSGQVIASGSANPAICRPREQEFARAGSMKEK